MSAATAKPKRGTFEWFRDRIPTQVIGSYDPHYHKTLADLAWIAQHEVDLIDEGEVEASREDRRTIIRFWKAVNTARARAFGRQISRKVLRIHERGFFIESAAEKGVDFMTWPMLEKYEAKP